MSQKRGSLNHPKQIVGSLRTLRNEDKLCDVTIIIGQEQLKAHRLVLMAASKYFEAMFTNETKEAKTGIVEFIETPPEIVKQCIEFIYTGEAAFSMKNAKDFLNASEMMQLNGLSDLYVQFLSERVNAENCIELMSLALLYEKKLLEKGVQDFLLKNFDTFSKAKSFLSLDQDLLKYCLTLLEACGEELEILKWKGVVSWAKRDIENRRNVFSDLFKLIDLSYLSKKFIKEDILSEPLVRETVECLCAVTDSAFRDHEEPKASPTPQRTMCRMLACGNVSRLIHRYDPKSKAWYQVTRFPSCDIENVDIITHRGAIYIGTGNFLYKYSTLWSTLFDGRYYRTPNSCYNRCIGSENVVYMISAKNRITYTLSSEKVTHGSAGCNLGIGFVVAASDKMVYALGGSLTNYKSLEVISSQPISNLNCPRSEGIAFWFNNMLYAVGGGSEQPECYNPATDRWQVISGIKISCYGAKSYIGDKLYIFGGSQSEEVLSVELDELKLPEDQTIHTPTVDMKLCCAVYP